MSHLHIEMDSFWWTPLVNGSETKYKQNMRKDSLEIRLKIPNNPGKAKMQFFHLSHPPGDQSEAQLNC